MTYFPVNEVLDLFSILNKSNVEYILLRNIMNELPAQLQRNKDIDIIVQESQLNKIHDFLIQNKWIQIKHPFGSIPFLYGMTPFKFYNKNGLHLDICCQLACRSLNNGEWFPLDMEIQEDLWRNKIPVIEEPWKYTLAVEDELIHLITRSVFDKKQFNKGYIERIEQLLLVGNETIILKKMNLIFFKFSTTLMVLLKDKNYTQIYKSYIQFKEY